MADTQHWTDDTLRSRINSASISNQRYEAGSPGTREIQAIAAALPKRTGPTAALILGMTPELRNMAVRHFDRVFTIDCNPQSIDLYTSWLDPEYASKETIIKGDWFHINTLIPEKVDGVFGDGVFGNLPDIGAHRTLLRRLKSAVKTEGYMVFRKIVIPANFNPENDHYHALLNRYRNGELDADEFGFGVRILGHLDCCYNSRYYCLDNKKLFCEMNEEYQRGTITAEEKSAIWRYYFGGTNCILAEQTWERLLFEEEIRFSRVPLKGKDWYRYYPIYRLQPV